MDFFQYKNLRAFAMEPLGKYIGAGSVYRTSSHMHGPATVLEKEAKLALHLCDCLDLSPTETAAAHLLAAVTKQRTVAWCYEQETPDDCLPLAPFTVEQEKLLCDQTREAASAYAAFLPERQAAAMLALVPEPQAATPAPVTDSASNAPAWTVSKPLRYNGYTAPLHRLIAAAHRDGKPCPTARDVVEAWCNNAPAEIAKMLPDGFDYYDTKGDTKTADLEAIRKAIGRMTIAR